MSTITQIITAIPTPPSSSDPSSFDIKADAFLSALPTLGTELNTLKGQINTVSGEISGKAEAVDANVVWVNARADDTIEARNAAITAAGNADTFAGNAHDSATTASSAATTATTKAGESAASASTASTAATTATTKASEAFASATTAVSAKIDAESARDTTLTARDAAEASATTATTKASEAQSSASSAASSKTDAESARDVAVSSKDLAVVAKDTAVSSATTATTKADAANASAIAAAASAVEAADVALGNIPYATTDIAGKVALATQTETIAGTDATKAITSAGVNQAVFSRMRDTLGVFPGIIPPTLNLFCRDMTSDTAPLGTFTRSATALRVGPTGVDESVASGGLRREWGLDGGLLGWLFEGQQTNPVLSPFDFTDAVWVKPLVAPTISTGEADLFGGATGQALSKSTSDDVLLRQLITLVADTNNITVSAYVKKKDGGAYKISLTDTSTFTERAITYNAATSTITSTVGVASSRVSDGPNGFKRFSFTVANTNLTSWAIDILPLSVSLPDILQGVQVERGVAPSSLIPTTTAAVTRPPDVWTIPTSEFPFNSRSFTLFLDFRVLAFESKVIAGFGNGSTFDNSAYVAALNGNTIHFNIGSGVDIELTANAMENTRYRVAVSCHDKNFSACINGGGVLKNTTGALPQNLSLLSIASSPWSTGADNANIILNQLACFSGTFIDSKLQLITA